MKYFDWDELKNLQLKTERGVSFEDVYAAYEDNRIIDGRVHPNKKRYSNQRIMYMVINNYVYLVPYVETKDKIFLKTIIPSRSATRDYFKQPRKGE